MLKKPLHLHLFAVAALGPGVSGGDKIFIETARVWSATGLRMTIYVTEEGRDMCARYHLTNVEFVVLPVRPWLTRSFAFHYFLKTWKILRYAFRLRLDESHEHALWSAGDSLPDVLPAWILRCRHATARWMASFYFFAPTPWPSKRDQAYRGGHLPVSFRSAIYWFFQQIAYPLIRRRADFVLVCNDLDKEWMKKDGVPASKILPLYGGVDLEGIDRVSDPETRDYDGCFVGRFHIQKGVLILMDIWREVARRRPGARLAIIGEGSLQPEMERKIREYGLGKNIVLLGYLDGEAKYRILKASRVFLHTPTHDTGGMAAAEAMACRRPVVAFDLPGYRHCYPRGMRKTPLEDAKAFAEAVETLLSDSQAYAILAAEAREFAESWAWPARAEEIKEVLLRTFEDVTAYDAEYYSDRSFCDEEVTRYSRKEKIFNLEWASDWSGVDLFQGTGKTALDAGCGVGHNAFLLTELGYRVTARDLSDFAICRAREMAIRRKMEGVDWGVMDFDQDEFPGQHDLVICWEVIEHVRDPDRVLRKLYEALKPGGLLLLTTPNRLGLSHMLWDRDPTHIQVHSSLGWAKRLRRLRPDAFICRAFMFWDHLVPFLRKRPKVLVTPFPLFGFRVRMAVRRKG